MNEQSRKNLIPWSEWDPEQHREASRRGGIASGESRQRRRLLREELDTLLRSGDLQQKVCLALLQKCQQGDCRAFAILRDSLGERLPDGIDVNVSGASQDLQDWKNAHVQELQELLIEDLNREDGIMRYEGITSLLSYQERLDALSADPTVQA